MNQQYPSALLEKAVNEFAKLPGIGSKTAMRLVLHLLRQDTGAVDSFGSAIVRLKHEVKYCKVCHNISDTEICELCENPQRDHATVCVVENIQDVMAIENTSQYRGIGEPGEGRRDIGNCPGFEPDHGRGYDKLLYFQKVG